MIPLNNIINQIIYCSPTISHVMVNGEWTIASEKPVRFDLKGLLVEATEIWKRIEPAFTSAVREAGRIRSQVEPEYRKYLERLRETDQKVKLNESNPGSYEWEVLTLSDLLPDFLAIQSLDPTNRGSRI